MVVHGEIFFDLKDHSLGDEHDETSFNVFPYESVFGVIPSDFNETLLNLTEFSSGIQCNPSIPIRTSTIPHI